MSEADDLESSKSIGSAKSLRYNLYKPERDPFLCTCGPCKKFWRDTFSESGELLREPTQCRAHHTAILSSQSKVVKIGDRVIVHGKYPGTVKWVGVLDEDTIAPELYVGVRLDDNINSTHNGVYNGKRYFHVPRGHGAMIKYTEVIPVKLPERKPPMAGNYMFPSWEEVQKRRKERNQKLQTIYASAGMTGPQFVEPYASMGKTKGIYKEPTIHISDPNDIALRDLEKKAVTDTKRKTVQREDREQREMETLQQQFGGGEEGARLALTVRKLRQAHQEGKQLMRKRSMRPDHIDTASESGTSDR